MIIVYDVDELMLVDLEAILLLQHINTSTLHSTTIQKLVTPQVR